MLLLLSLVAAWYSLVRPAWGMIAARGWVEHECEIVSSRIQSSYTRNSSGKSSLSESLAIVYRYEYAGRIHVVDDVDFYGGLAIRDAVRDDILARFPEDTTQPCYLDPADPGECVLDRGFRTIYLLGLIPLLMVLLFANGLRRAIRSPPGS
ncbi:DUF3592 domain-containing protein [Nannocystis radixulma]|uniref:DUF3592 domain-containing protein n=1 Tax=Nannocystis radixulma TaxID=2995305 RepID=A0ABT5AXB0_9BACT|nr:DUF3592 domain-containing protein [Nannocystis radixulma]MDC0666484.1 DUF3592 domain-containing protein [Nannocystis radixulma]